MEYMRVTDKAIDEVIDLAATEDVFERHSTDDTEHSVIGKFRRWFEEAADWAADWREEAKQDYDFVAGKQWEQADIERFHESGRPAITINRIKPLINVLSGYQRLNRYDIEFLPRTGDDVDICQVRKGITKYILDECDYDSEESHAFIDAAIGGLGWFDVGYKFRPEVNDGEAYVKREDPFSIYVDPEAHKTDFSDAKYICRAKWVDKDELVITYPEHKAEIMAQYAIYDNAEKNDGAYEDPLWYKRDIQKARMVECWYKVKERESIYYMQDGSVLAQGEITPEHFLSGAVQGYTNTKVTKVRCAVFIERFLLEDIPSPYEHGEFPFVPIVCYNYGTGDLPAGFVRDLKDPQREINKRRIQELHILNTTGNGGGWIEEDAMDSRQKAEFERKGNTPGYFAEVRPGAISQGKIHERIMGQIPAAVIQAENQATADLTAVSGINEALMGTDIASTSSGRAIELKQKQAITHIAPMFDNLRKAKKKIAYRLWGKRGFKGIIPQYYTDDKVYRVEGKNGQQFIRVNQQVIQQDPLGRIIHQTLNNLSEGEFDIVISDTQASTTQRQAQLWSLVDSVKNLGIPGDLIFDVILDLSDLPNKEEIKQRWQQRQQAQAQAQQQQAQQQLQLEMIKNQSQSQSISFKDAPLPIQLAMAAKQGLIDAQIAQYAINLSVQQMFPQLAEQMQQQAQQAAVQQQMQLAAQQQQEQQAQPSIAQQPNNGRGQGGGMTQAAVQSLINGQGPAI